jgi:transcriptional regulator with XRE-family HTH domain
MLAKEAQRLGVSIAAVSKVTIGRYERGQSRPSALYALLLCRSLSVEPADLALDDLLTPERVEMLLDSVVEASSRRVGAHRAASWAHDQRTPASPEPHQLPADLADFVGRVGELSSLVAILDPSREPRSGLPGICVIAGKPGVGKSALAVHAGHRLISRFPDVQLYVDLRGVDAEPQQPHAILRWFLHSLGIPEAEIPQSLERCAALYRSAIHARRALVVLDNALDEAQVRPLLPGSSDAAVIITSRSRLRTLPGSHLIELGELHREEAMDLLERLAGDERMQREPDAAQEIMRACAGLPLALRIAGAALKGQQLWTVTRLALRLADERDRLDLLRLGDLDVRASFDLSYRELRPADARVFRLLSVIPGTDWSAGLVAALIEGGLREAEDALDHLREMQLVEVAAGGRYRLHDLLRLFASEHLRAEEPASEPRSGRSRALRWYLDSARAAAQELSVTRGQPSVIWFETERANLLQAVVTAHYHRCWDVGIGIAEALSSFLSLRGYRGDQEVVLELAYDCAVQLGDRFAEARILLNLGTMRAKQG